MLIEMEPTAHGVHYRSETIFADGRTLHSEYSADYDGKESMVMGAHGMLLPVTLKRTDPKTVVATYTRGFQVIAVSRRTVSLDGRSMTITTTSKNQSGKNVTNVGVYDRSDTSAGVVH